MEFLAFAFTTGLAQILTNIDNLAVLAAMLVVGSGQRAVAGYVAAQCAVLGLALLVSAGISDVLGQHVGYLGIIPIFMGLREFWLLRTAPGSKEALGTNAPVSVQAAILVFLSLSTDSFAILVPLLADSEPGFRWAAILGAGSAITLMAVAGRGIASAARGTEAMARRLRYVGPAVMILAGIYVLLNTGTDMI